MDGKMFLLEENTPLSQMVFCHPQEEKMDGCSVTSCVYKSTRILRSRMLRSIKHVTRVCDEQLLYGGSSRIKIEKMVRGDNSFGC